MGEGSVGKMSVNNRKILSTRGGDDLYGVCDYYILFFPSLLCYEYTNTPFPPSILVSPLTTGGGVSVSIGPWDSGWERTRIQVNGGGKGC